MILLHHLLAFFVLLGVLIVVHEYGHFCVARSFGVKILRFSVGFGRPLWSWRLGPDRTEWVIGIFPLGGYVKMLDEADGEIPATELRRSFNRQSLSRRMAIVAAGPVANLLLAILIYWGLFFHGMDEPKPILGAPVANSPAAAAGFEDGDLVVKVAGVPVLTRQDMRWNFIQASLAGRGAIDFEVVSAQHELLVRHVLPTTFAADSHSDPVEATGFSFYRPQVPPVVGKVLPGSVAERAGVLPGDQILAIDGTPVTTWFDVVQAVRGAPDRSLTLTCLRQRMQVRIDIKPTARSEHGAVIGQIGVLVREPSALRQELMVRVRYGVFTSLGKAINEASEKSIFTLVSIGKMLVGEVSWRNISGPVSIADYAGRSAQMGFSTYLKFMALVSISLFVLNLLPVPILDGGHLLYYVLEFIRRKPISPRALEFGQQIGAGVLLLLMAFAFLNDINRLISG